MADFQNDQGSGADVPRAEAPRPRGLRGAVPLALSFSVQEAIATYPGLDPQAAARPAGMQGARSEG